MDEPRRCAGNGVLHGQPGDLVAELQRRAVAGEQPRGEQLVHGGRGALSHRLQQRELHPAADQRGRVQHRAAPAVQSSGPGQHRVPGGGRDLVAGVHAGRDDLAQVERVPAGQLAQCGRVPFTAARHDLNRAGRQRAEADPPHRALAGQVPEGELERVAGGQPVVPVGREEQDGRVPDPPAQETQQVDGGVVGPVDVLHHHHVQRIGLADLAQQGPEQGFAGGVRAAQVEELTAELGGDVEERAKRSGGEQPVAGAPVPARAGQVALQLLDQCRFADARLAGHQDQPALGLPGLPRVAGQGGQLRFPFQQHVSATFPPRRPGPAERPGTRPPRGWARPTWPARLRHDDRRFSPR